MAQTGHSHCSGVHGWSANFCPGTSVFFTSSSLYLFYNVHLKLWWVSCVAASEEARLPSKRQHARGNIPSPLTSTWPLWCPATPFPASVFNHSNHQEVGEKVHRVVILVNLLLEDRFYVCTKRFCARPSDVLRLWGDSILRHHKCISECTFMMFSWNIIFDQY